MSVVLQRQVPLNFVNTETGEAFSLTKPQDFAIITEGNALHFVRQGSLGTKICTLTDAELKQYRALESPEPKK